MNRTMQKSLPGALLVVLAFGAALAAAPKRPTDGLSYPKLNPIRPATVVRETLPNGMKLLLIEDRELPRVEFQAMVYGGRLAEPKGKPGLAELFGEVLRTGGTTSTSGDAVDEKLERIGAAIESSVDENSSGVYARALTENVDAVLPLFAEFLASPAFAQEKIDLAKTHLKSGISRRNDEVMEIAQREFLKLIYGASSPYARQYEYSDVDSLTRDDLVAYHALCFRPDRTILAAWGDFEAAAMKERIAKAFTGWKSAGAPSKFDLPPIPPPAFSVNYVEKKDVEQTFILLGHQGLRYDDPDYPAVRLMGEILGGGFSSRIFVQVRTEKGLAYAAGGTMVPAYDHPGNFFFFTSTKPASTAEALSTVLDEIRKIRESPVTDAELRRAKEGYLNTFVFDFDNKGKVVNRLMTYDFYGYPADFNTKLRDAIERVTKEDVLRVAQKHLRPEALTILAIGKAEEFDKPLSTFGQVRTLDITIPPPKPSEEIPAATPESLARGRDLFLAAARARGEAALRNLKDLYLEGTTTAQTPMGPMDLGVKLLLAPPDRARMEMATPMGTVLQVLDGERAWMAMGPNVQDLPESMVGEIRSMIASSAAFAFPLRDALAGKGEVQAIGKTQFEGKEAEAVVLRLAGEPIRVYLSPETSLIVGQKSVEETPSGPAEVVSVFSSYAEVSGFKVPMEIVQTADGKPIATTKLTTVKVNGGVDPAAFQKPTPPK